MHKIRVLMVAGTMDIGGQENQIMNVLRYADKEKFQIDFTTTMHNPYYRSEIEGLGGKCLVLPVFDWKNPLPYCKALYQIMINGQYDIVHSHELFHSGITVRIAKKAGVPIRIAHSHSSSSYNGKKINLIRKMYYKCMRGWILKYSTERIACSTMAGNYLFGKQSFEVIYNSVDSKRFLDAVGDPNLLPGSEKWKKVLHVGHVIPLKNHDFMIDICDSLKKNNRKIEIICVGSGDECYINHIKDRINLLGLKEYFYLIGLRKDIPELMKSADAFILPSLFEGMPLVMIEAQASGLPCVAAATFSKEVDFELGNVQWLSLDNSVDEWVKAIESAIEMAKVENNIILEAIEEKGFDSKVFADKILGMYQKAVIEENEKN